MKKFIVALTCLISVICSQKSHAGLAIMGSGGALIVAGSIANSSAVTYSGAGAALLATVTIVAGIKISNIQLVILDENDPLLDPVLHHLRSELPFLDNQDFLRHLANSVVTTHFANGTDVSKVYFSEEIIQNIITNEQLDSEQAYKVQQLLGEN